MEEKTLLLCPEDMAFEQRRDLARKKVQKFRSWLSSVDVWRRRGGGHVCLHDGRPIDDRYEIVVEDEEDKFLEDSEMLICEDMQEYFIHLLQLHIKMLCKTYDLE